MRQLINCAQFLEWLQWRQSKDTEIKQRNISHSSEGYSFTAGGERKAGNKVDDVRLKGNSLKLTEEELLRGWDTVKMREPHLAALQAEGMMLPSQGTPAEHKDNSVVRAQEILLHTQAPAQPHVLRAQKA